jgi:hypothetical protein
MSCWLVWRTIRPPVTTLVWTALNHFARRLWKWHNLKKGYRNYCKSPVWQLVFFPVPSNTSRSQSLILVRSSDSRRSHSCLQFFHVKGKLNACTYLKIVYCYTSYTRQSIVEREGLEHDERSEECSEGTSSTTCLVKRLWHVIFSTSASLI